MIYKSCSQPRASTAISAMVHKSIRNLISLLMLLLPVFLPFGSSLSFNFPSFNSSTPTFLNLKGDAFWNHAIQLTNTDIYSSGSSAGAAVYPQPLLLWDSATRNLTDFATHFSFKLVATNNASLCSGLAFFLSPYPYAPPDISSALDASQNPIVAVEFGASRNKGPGPSNCHVGIDINSIESDPYISCNDGLTGGRTSSATISYSSSTRSLAVLVMYDVHEDEPGSVGTLMLSHEVDLRDILPNEVAIGLSAAAADSSTELHEILSWNFSSTLQAPAASAAPSPAQPMNDSRAYAASSKDVKLLTGLVSSSLGAAMVVVGTVCSILWYKMTKLTKLTKHGKDDGSIKPQVLANPSPGPSPQVQDPSSINAVFHAVKAAVREEFRSMFPSTLPVRCSSAPELSSLPMNGPPLAELHTSLFLNGNSRIPVLEAVAGITEQPASSLGHRGPTARQDARGANRSERLLHKRIFNWLYSRLFKSEHLGCLRI